jgi:hypothetical protein
MPVHHIDSKLPAQKDLCPTSHNLSNDQYVFWLDPHWPPLHYEESKLTRTVDTQYKVLDHLPNVPLPAAPMVLILLPFLYPSIFIF